MGPKVLQSWALSKFAFLHPRQQKHWEPPQPATIPWSPRLPVQILLEMTLPLFLNSAAQHGDDQEGEDADEDRGEEAVEPDKFHRATWGPQDSVQRTDGAVDGDGNRRCRARIMCTAYRWTHRFQGTNIRESLFDVDSEAEFCQDMSDFDDEKRKAGVSNAGPEDLLGPEL
ncbi:MAG: hypothetical protein Q9184_006318 [Pyrenodesmia sp. 2 TL-2023]